MKKFLLLAASLVTISSANAYVALGDVNVRVVEGSYMPSKVQIQASAGSPNCSTGSWLSFSKSDTAANKAFYAAAMTALVTNRKMAIYLEDGSCNIQFYHSK